ncbi:unnamed protein product [Rotaria magnacalcarata]|uniref:Uncharacterized protein n=1 Tax=Rotaria magnacalcarata TaxID=392030 RepID=A0A816U6N7_9BILA|nr:unnamed protein product [Rotaria magnacalcarata]CAF2242681.1 unnamed protein product [Rotaria magnacalcarata]CAF4078017.1 unnamed protein product [Rotaria magnacalcarata]
MFESITGGITNRFIIGTTSVALIIRIVRQKHRLNQEFHWHKYRKMAIQIIAIVLLFYFFYLPAVITGSLASLGVLGVHFETLAAYVQFFSYNINFLLPAVCAGTLPRLKIKN